MTKYLVFGTPYCTAIDEIVHHNKHQQEMTMIKVIGDVSSVHIVFYCILLYCIVLYCIVLGYPSHQPRDVMANLRVDPRVKPEGQPEWWVCTSHEQYICNVLY